MVPLIGWAVVVALALTWQGLALVHGSDFPTISDMLDTVTDNLAGRWILFALWLWLGWHVFVRGWQSFLGE